MIVFSIKLGFTDARSDKVYKVQIDEVQGGYTVGFAYGRRGSALTTGLKTKAPVTLEKAKAIADKLVKSKTKKGYVVEDGGEQEGTIVPQSPDTVEWFHPMLLNPITTLDALEWAAGGNVGLQVKRDGERRGVRIGAAGVAGASRLRTGASLGAHAALEAIGKLMGGELVLDAEDCGAKLYVFDVLVWKGQELRDQPFSVRASVLQELALEVARLPMDMADRIVVDVPFVPGTRAETEEFINSAVRENEEGVVLKDLDAPYEPGRPGRDGPARKLKFWESATVLVGEASTAKRSVRMFVWEGGQKLFIGRVTIPSNAAVPQEGTLAEVRYLYAMGGGSLIQPTYLGPRTDVTEEAATMAQLKMKKVA